MSICLALENSGPVVDSKRLVFRNDSFSHSRRNYGNLGNDRAPDYTKPLPWANHLAG